MRPPTTWTNARKNTIGAFVFVGPPVGGATFMALTSLLYDASPVDSLRVVFFTPFVAPIYYMFGWIPAFLTGLTYSLLMRRRSASLYRMSIRLSTGATVGAICSTLVALLIVYAQPLEWLPLLATVAVSGALAGGVCALLFPTGRWRDAF